ncbi:MAG: HRDC domain-containing protein [Saprospiraceae bacterium]
MQIKLYTIPILGGERLNEEMNVFLRTKKILQVDSRLVSEPQGACWCFCIKYVDDLAATERERPKVDYREVLDEATFRRFAQLREVRKRLAQEEGIPAYAIFTDEELAALAKIEELTPAAMRSVKGVGEKKVEKYGAHFIQKNTP